MKRARSVNCMFDSTMYDGPSLTRECTLTEIIQSLPDSWPPIMEHVQAAHLSRGLCVTASRMQQVSPFTEARVGCSGYESFRHDGGFRPQVPHSDRLKYAPRNAIRWLVRSYQCHPYG